MRVAPDELPLQHIQLSHVAACQHDIADPQPIHAQSQQEGDETKKHPVGDHEFREGLNFASGELKVEHDRKAEELECKKAAIATEQDKCLEIAGAHTVIGVGAVVVLNERLCTILDTHLQMWQWEVLNGLYRWFYLSHFFFSV